MSTFGAWSTLTQNIESYCEGELQDKVAATLIAMRGHLEQLVRNGCDTWSDHSEGELVCHYCGEGQVRPNCGTFHKPDCAWFQAKAFLERGCMP